MEFGWEELTVVGKKEYTACGLAGQWTCGVEGVANFNSLLQL